jgi:alkaline phosphatase D
MMFLTSLAVLATVMLGPVTMQEATIWVRTDRPATVHVEYVDGRGRSFRTRDVRTSHETALTASLICDSVVPGMTYTYRVIIDGDAVATDVPTSFTTPALWKWRSDELPSASIMFGSCFYVNEDGYERWDSTGRERGYGSEFEILDAMTRTPSDVMLWLGDNIYLREADWTSRTGILRRHTHTRSFPALQPFLLSRPHYAIWDDHDFGPDNSSKHTSSSGPLPLGV